MLGTTLHPPALSQATAVYASAGTSEQHDTMSCATAAGEIVLHSHKHAMTSPHKHEQSTRSALPSPTFCQHRQRRCCRVL